MGGGRLPGLEAGWPGSFVAPPPAACWPSVALVVMGMLFLARPLGRPARILSIAACAARARTGQPAHAGSGWLAADHQAGSLRTIKLARGGPEALPRRHRARGRHGAARRRSGPPGS